MEAKKFCQSCSMPIDNIELRGAEKDGSKSDEYCMYCYSNGAFINPTITLDEMKVIVKTQMEKRNISASITQMALNILPQLKRWRKTSMAH